MLQFKTSINNLIELTLESATVITTTMATAATPKLYINFSPILIACDEFARAKEPDLLLLIDK